MAAFVQSDQHSFLSVHPCSMISLEYTKVEVEKLKQSERINNGARTISKLLSSSLQALNKAEYQKTCTAQPCYARGSTARMQKAPKKWNGETRDRFCGILNRNKCHRFVKHEERLRNVKPDPHQEKAKDLQCNGNEA